MPQGYYTIEQLKQPKRDAKAEWIVVQHLPFGESLTAAENAIQKMGTPGFYRVIHTQRVIWAEKETDKLRLRKSHAGSPRSLQDMQEMFERCDGK